jgi:mannose-1-phosphate guanylyltransferase
MQLKIQPVIMAGGYGTRLWPLSFDDEPKQFLKINQTLSLFQRAVVNNVFFTNPVVIINHKHEKMALEQLAEISAHCEVIIEPDAKGTAICSILASLITNEKAFDFTMLIPSDLLINDTQGYIETARKAARFVDKSKVVTLGIKPHEASTNYGYIEYAKKISEGVYFASRFIEKPCGDKATEYIDQGNFLWNSGIFLYNPRKFLLMAEQLEPNLCTLAESIWKTKKIDKNLIYMNAQEYSQITPNTIDYAFMEKINDIIVVASEFDWHDLGDFISFFSYMDKDLDHNYLSPNSFALDVKNSLIIHDKKIALALGLENVIIVSNKDGLLIASKDKLQNLKYLLQKSQTL